MPIAPTLILGLGGSGSRIIEKVAQKVSETSSNQSERIAFVAFDTDINDLAGIKRRSPLIRTVQTSTRSTVGEYLNINTNARDNWFPINEMLNRKTLTEGAAQVRAISRLAFDTTLKAGNLDPLHRAVEQLFRIDKDQEEQALRVIITSSLAGGTGSGLILPVAMYLSNFLRMKYPKAKAITRGFFIQPDVFFTVIGATEEQQNLQVNAYAAVRELDAFLMKGDNTLPEQYRDLRFEFPKVGADGVDVINAMPYDFCFLFDATNTSGAGLDSFTSYEDHAATCIYTQSIGPMSKRSNSREDNVLREVIKYDGRNRYAGAGASRLVYPWQHLRDFVAYKWADLALSTQWLMFDDQIKGQREALAKQRELGHPVQDIDTGQAYIAAVDNSATNQNPFAKSIQSQCLAYDEEGISVIGKRWLEYVSALKDHVRKSAERAGDESRKRNTMNKISSLAETKEPDDYVATYYDMKRYQDVIKQRIEEQSGMIAYTLFKAENESVTKDRNAHQLETYLRDKVSNNFVHPASARYFLYQTLKVLKEEKQRVQTTLDATIKYLNDFERTTFDDPSTDEVESPEDFINRKQSMRDRLRKRPGAELQEMIDKFQNYMKRVDQLREESVYVHVLDEGIAYVEGLTSSFETFFLNLDSNLRKLRTEIEMHRNRFDDLKGATTRYVFAESYCLDAAYKSMPYAGSVINVDSELSERIYNRVRQYYTLTDEKDGTYFQDLYQSDILGYFRESVMERYEPQIKIDIIEALEREYRAKKHDYEEAHTVHYVIDEIEKAKKLAAPFLEQPLGEERHPIQACAYNPRIEGESDPKRKSLIAEHLGNYGGERDEEISPQEILFYNAIYGIRARDLSKYAPARNELTEKRPAGSYFAAYSQLVSGIKPSVAETRVITPHIDRRWHTMAAMPDLDDSHQESQITDIHEAFFSGFAYGVIVWEQVHSKVHIYRYLPQRSVEQDFTVSNGTPCDQFYEVLDALMINPVAVDAIRATVERKFNGFLAKEQATTFLKSPLAEALNEGLSLGELTEVIPGMKGRQASVFDFIAFYAISVPRGEGSDVMLRSLTENILDYIRREVARVEEPADVSAVVEEVLTKQLARFEENYGLYAEKVGKAFARKARTMTRALVDFLDELRAYDLKEAAEGFEKKLQV